MKVFRAFLWDQQAQDVVEYSLLLAFVLLLTSALFLTGGGDVPGVWTAANGRLVDANAAVH